MMQWWVWLLIALAPSIVVGAIWPVRISMESIASASRRQRWTRRQTWTRDSA